MSAIPCTITCFLAAVILVAMIVMSLMVQYDPFIKSYRDQLSKETKLVYDKIVEERGRLFFTGYVIGFAVSVALIAVNIKLLKQKIPVSAMVCLTVVVSTVISHLYYTLSPKTAYMVSLLKTDKERADWLQVYKSMQFYFHISYALGIAAVGVFSYAFRGQCSA